MLSLARIEIKVIGEVQGVFFRQSAKKVADGLGIVGWVRNEPDGSVRIVVEGEEKELQKLIEWAKLGTEFAKVEDIQIQWSEATEEFDKFEIKV